MVDQGFGAAIAGYQLYKTTDLKIDAMTFAKTAEKFGKILGNDSVTGGKPNYWKEIYENFEKWSAQHIIQNVEIVYQNLYQNT